MIQETKNSFKFVEARASHPSETTRRNTGNILLLQYAFLDATLEDVPGPELAIELPVRKVHRRLQGALLETLSIAKRQFCDGNGFEFFRLPPAFLRHGSPIGVAGFARIRDELQDSIGFDRREYFPVLPGTGILVFADLPQDRPVEVVRPCPRDGGWIDPKNDVELHVRVPIDPFRADGRATLALAGARVATIVLRDDPLGIR